MSFSALACAVLAGLALLARLFPHFRKSFLAELPCPPDASSIWGHEKSVFRQEPGRAFREWCRHLGLTYRIKAAFAAPDILVLSDPEGIAHILQKHIYDYHHSKVVRPRIARLLGKGLGWVEGEEEHRRMRKLVGPSLSPQAIKSMSNEIMDATNLVLLKLVQHVQAENGTCRVNVLDWTSRSTLNVIGRAIFAHDFQGGSSEDAEKILTARRKGVSPIASYAGFLTLMLLRRFHILNDLPISAIQAQGIVKTTIQAGVAQEMLRKTAALASSKEDKGSDLLSRLLSAHNDGRISFAELNEQISTFVVSGHETTTMTLGFTIWELARAPALQDKLRKELEAFGKEPTFEDYQNHLPYLDACLRETLRLYPGLPYMERVATKDDTIPLRKAVPTAAGSLVHSVVVRPGQTVLIPIIAIHRLDSVWTAPDDFRPDRWLDSLPPKEDLCSGWGNLLAFSDGPRNCIGFRLAIFQYKVILTALMKHFVFRDTGHQISLKVSSSLQPWVIGEAEKGPQLPVIFEEI